MINYFDLHCDTLYKATTENSNFFNNEFHVSLEKIDKLNKYYQLMAIWTPDTIKGEQRTVFLNNCIEKYKNEKVFNDNVKLFLSVENLGCLNGKIENFDILVENDIKCATLTWNADNELGSGCFSETDKGLTEFGKEILSSMHKNNITVDISHTDDKLFYDIVKNTNDRIIASHSNSREMTNFPRNITDEMFVEIRNRHGLVGLNFCPEFLNNDGEKAGIDDLVIHANHFLKLGGEDTLAMGSDFDGTDLPNGIEGIQDIDKIYTRFTREFGEKLTNKIFFENAQKFFDFFD